MVVIADFLKLLSGCSLKKNLALVGLDSLLNLFSVRFGYH